MDKKTYKNWEGLTDKMLNDSWKFRNLCGRPFDRGFIGELLVLKQLLKRYRDKLCSSLDNDIVYAGSANKEWDIKLALDAKTILLNAKATTVLDTKNKPRWVRQDAKSFCDIKIDKKGQWVLPKKSNPGLFYVFVDVGTWLKNKNADYFILSDKMAKLKFGKKYSNLYNGKTRKTGSTDFWVEYSDVKSFKDKFPRSN